MESSAYSVELDVFEGPLDLLLHLVKKHELDIFDIPISFVTEKYLEYLDLMKQLNLDVAGEYLLMAATLAYIKSRELLPPAENESGEEELELELEEADPRQELIRRLLEYQKYKEAAEMLGDRPVVGRNIWTRGAPQEDVLAENIESDAVAPLAEFPVTKLLEALDRLFKKAKIVASHEVSLDRLSVSQVINQISERLESEDRISLSSCFRFLTEPMTEEEARHEVVTTFLSILEMAKLKLIKVSQPIIEQDDEEIYIERAVSDIKDRLGDALGTEDEYR